VEALFQKVLRDWEIQWNQICLLVVGKNAILLETIRTIARGKNQDLLVLTCFKESMQNVVKQCEIFLAADNGVKDTLAVFEFIYR
jgi:hypothetical protein